MSVLRENIRFLISSVDNKKKRETAQVDTLTKKVRKVDVSGLASIENLKA